MFDTRKRKTQKIFRKSCATAIWLGLDDKIWPLAGHAQHHISSMRSHASQQHMFIFLDWFFSPLLRCQIIYETRRATTEPFLFHRHAINKSLPRRAAIYGVLVYIFAMFLRLKIFFSHFLVSFSPLKMKWNEFSANRATEQQSGQRYGLASVCCATSNDVRIRKMFGRKKKENTTLPNKHDNHLNIHFQSFSHSTVWHMNHALARSPCCMGRRRRRRHRVSHTTVVNVHSHWLAYINHMPKRIRIVVHKIRSECKHFDFS